MDSKGERPNRPVFCDAKSDIKRNGVTEIRTYLHLAIGIRFCRDTYTRNPASLICESAFKVKVGGYRQPHPILPPRERQGGGAAEALSPYG